MHLFLPLIASFSLLAITLTDSELASHVRHAIQNDHDLSNYGRSVQVTANDGAITLTGEVQGNKEKKKIVHLVKKIEGVNKVNDKLTTTFKNSAN